MCSTPSFSKAGIARKIVFFRQEWQLRFYFFSLAQQGRQSAEAHKRHFRLKRQTSDDIWSSRFEGTTTAEASKVTDDNLQNKSFEQAEEWGLAVFSSQLFSWTNLKKRKRRDCGSTAARVLKLLRRDPSGKDGRDLPQWCITLPSIMNTSGYHQHLWGGAMLTHSAEPLTSCLWTSSCLFERRTFFISP